MNLFSISWGLALMVTLNLAQAEPGVVLSLSGIGERVRSQNPELAAARLRIREAIGRQTQAGRLQNPELGFELSHDARYRQRAAEISLTQRFPLTQRLSLEKSVTAAEVKVAQAEVADVERQLVYKAREGLVQVLVLRQKRELLKSQSQASLRFAEALQESVSRGETSALDAGQAKLEAAGAELQLRQIDAEEAAAVGSLRPLLGMQPSEALHVSGTLPAPVLPSGTVNPARRPDYQAALHEIEAARQGVALEQSKRREDAQAGVFFSGQRMEDVPRGFDSEGMIGLRFSLPIPFWNRNEGAIQEAEARRIRLEKQATALNRGIRLEADTALNEMKQWLRLFQETEQTLLPLADQQMTAAEDAYRKGQGELTTVFRSRERQMQLRSSRLESLRQFHLARVRYETALAQP